MTRNSIYTLVSVLVFTACGGDNGGEDAATTDDVSGAIEIDGSSTVYPITEAVAEEYGKATSGKVMPTIGFSGTGGGFKRFCAGETQISNASRPIKDSEKQLCQQNGVEFEEIQVAIDGLVVVVHPENTAVECLTVDELKKMWAPGSTVKNWTEVRQGLASAPIKLYGPGTNSGTFDYFTEAVMGETGASRADYTASEDDNVLVQGVAGDRNALGYFGYAYFEENAARLKPIGIDGGQGCITPTPETVKNGTYAPLSRPLFIYVNRTALQQAHVQGFVRFYLENAAELVPEVGYVPLDAAHYQTALGRIGT